MAQRRASRGFTLIEMIVTVAVLGLLATIALPHYKSSVFRAQRTEAVLGLEAINTSELAYYGSHDEFASSFTQLEFWAYGQQLSPTEMVGRRYSYILSQPNGPKTYLCTAYADLDGEDGWVDKLVAFERF